MASEVEPSIATVALMATESFEEGQDDLASDALPKISQDAIDQIPASVAHGLRLIPIRRDGMRIFLVCERPLSKEQRQDLAFCVPGRECVFLDDPREEVEVRRNLNALLARYYQLLKGGTK